MNLSMSTLKDLKILKTDALICRFLKKIWSIWLLRVYILVIEKTLDGSSFYSINQLQARALSQETKF